MLHGSVKRAPTYKHIKIWLRRMTVPCPLRVQTNIGNVCAIPTGDGKNMAATASSPEKTLASARQFVQECLSQNPVIVLGSGASAGLGLPTMTDLAKQIAEAVQALKLAGDETRKWEILKQALDANLGLEQALDRSNLDEQSTLYQTIIHTVWRSVTWGDLKAFAQTLADPERLLPHAKLFKYLFDSSTRRVSVITPNYDRLAEYGADQAGYCHQTGFSHGYRRNWQGPGRMPRLHRPDVRQDERTVEILKVHGSVDWFQTNGGELLALPLWAREEGTLELPTGAEPVIVPPTKSKYRQSQFDPYRSLMTEADRVLKAADAFLCVGYGFNDEHVQLYLTQSLRHRAKPLVMVTYSVTPKAAEALKQAAGSLRYCVLSAVLDREGKATPGKCRVATHEHPDGVEIEGIEAWSFDGFANEFL